MKKITINFLALLTASLFLSQSFSVVAQDKKEPPLKETEKYFVELLTYLDKIDKDGNATSKDWENYVKKITKGNVRISIPKNLSEKEKEDWLKTLALILLYTKNQFGFELPRAIKELKCEPSPPGTFGHTEGSMGNVTITCPPNQSTSWMATVVLHELAHRMLGHPAVAGREYEDDVHNFIRRILPDLIDEKNLPKQYDLFTPKEKKDNSEQRISEKKTDSRQSQSQSQNTQPNFFRFFGR